MHSSFISKKPELLPSNHCYTYNLVNGLREQAIYTRSQEFIIRLTKILTVESKYKKELFFSLVTVMLTLRVQINTRRLINNNNLKIVIEKQPL